MHTLPLPERYNLALSALRRVENPLTVAHIRDTWETEEVDHLIGKANCCKSFEFNSLNYNRGYLAIEYNITLEVMSEQNRAETYRERISVRTHLDMNMTQLAELIIREIRAIA